MVLFLMLHYFPQLLLSPIVRHTLNISIILHVHAYGAGSGSANGTWIKMSDLKNNPTRSKFRLAKTTQKFISQRMNLSPYDLWCLYMPSFLFASAYVFAYYYFLLE